MATVRKQQKSPKVIGVVQELIEEHATFNRTFLSRPQLHQLVLNRMKWTADEYPYETFKKYMWRTETQKKVSGLHYRRHDSKFCRKPMNARTIRMRKRYGVQGLKEQKGIVRIFTDSVVKLITKMGGNAKVRKAAREFSSFCSSTRHRFRLSSHDSVIMSIFNVLIRMLHRKNRFFVRNRELLRALSIFEISIPVNVSLALPCCLARTSPFSTK